MRTAYRLLAGVLLLSVQTAAGQAYWQQEVHYQMDVTLKDQDHTLDGFLSLTYINHSPDTLSFLWFHLWPNAYKNDRTAFSEQLLENGRTDFYFADKEKRGYINQLDFRVGQSPCKMEDHPAYIDVVKVTLPQPLQPGDSIRINTPFHVQLPAAFSRSGHSRNRYLITQWYPKPAVYDKEGWHPMPYLDQGEFYAEFGSYNVQITVPSQYTVAAPGILLDSAEKQRLMHHAPHPIQAGKAAGGVAGKPTLKKQTAAPPPEKNTPTKTLHYSLQHAHDFAWFADTGFWVNVDTVRLPSGKIIELFSFYTATAPASWKKSTAFMKDAIRYRSALLGDYPYNSITAVETVMGFEGGMEYPGITAITGATSEKSLDIVLQHEIGHNWFQAALGSNEREYPWMDEGLNTYYDHRYENDKYPSSAPTKVGWNEEKMNECLLGTLVTWKKDQPIATPSYAFSPLNYQLIAYYKTAKWLETLEKAVGTPQFDSCMRTYYAQWKFKHPTPDDFLRIFGKPLSELQNALTEKHSPSYFTKGRKTIRTYLGWDFLARPNEIPLSFLPVPGYNKYDGLMPGIAVSNYNFPPAPLRFVVLPQWGIRSKQFNGIARVSVDHFLGNQPHRLQWSVGMKRYSYRSGVDSSGNRIHASFFTIAPAARLWWHEKTAKSTRERWVEWKTIFAGEQGFNYVQRKTDALYFPEKTGTRTRYVNQLTGRLAEYRALYPYEIQLQGQQGKDFYRINFTGQYFLNYPSGGGLAARFFAAKFGYIGTRTLIKSFSTIAYQPKLTAVRGNEDFTYSNVFPGRNETEGLAAQQILMRDGDLKIRTDLFMGLQGRSEKWVASLNLNSTLPSKLLPRFVPLRLFLDVGTYAEAWDRKREDPRFLFVGGLQLSVLKEVINIYAPLFYSSVFGENFRSVPGENGFFRKISFSIDLQRLNIRRISNNQLPF